MLDNIYENLHTFKYDPFEKRMIDLLRQTWKSISEDYIVSYLTKRRCFEVITDRDVCNAELRADDVRSAVYSNIRVMERTNMAAVDEWFDLSIEQQDVLLLKAFPDTQVYGV